jgi:phosphatidylinositol alpha-1,6-mannosyltransferase
MTADVLLIANNFPPVRGGSAAVYASLARYAAARIVVLAPCISYADGLPLIGWREHDRCAPFRVVRLKLLRTTMGPRRGPVEKALFVARDLLIRWRLAWSVLRLLLRERPRAVCVGELLASGWMLRLLSHVPRLRTLVYVHGEEITTDDPYDPGRRRCRRALRAADGIVVVSRFTEAAVLAMLGPAAADKVRLIGNGVDTARFVPGPRRPDLVAQFRLEGCFVFVSVCRLLEKKGIDQVLRAFAAMRDPACRFLVVGTGPYEPTLRALATALGIDRYVTFAGEVVEADLVDCYRLGDVFVMPNRALANGDTEGFGLVFLEANGCGLPVIAGGDGGSTDAVQDGVNGLVVDGGSVTAIAAAMQRLRADDALRARLRQGGLAMARQAGWEEKARAFLAFGAAAGGDGQPAKSSR